MDDLPDGVRTLFLVLTGMDWPSAREELMFRSARAQNKLGHRLESEIAPVIAQVVRTAGASLEGQAGDAFRASMAEFVAEPKNFVRSGAEFGTEYGAWTNKSAVEVEYMKLTAIATLAALVIELAIAAVKMAFPPTAPAGVAHAAAAQAIARATLRMVIMKVFRQIMQSIVTSTVFQVVMDTAVQLVQIAKGSRSSFDLSNTSRAIVTGVVSGAVVGAAVPPITSVARKALPPGPGPVSTIGNGAITWGASGFGEYLGGGVAGVALDGEWSATGFDVTAGVAEGAAGSAGRAIGRGVRGGKGVPGGGPDGAGPDGAGPAGAGSDGAGADGGQESGIVTVDDGTAEKVPLDDDVDVPRISDDAPGAGVLNVGGPGATGPGTVSVNEPAVRNGVTAPPAYPGIEDVPPVVASPADAEGDGQDDGAPVDLGSDVDPGAGAPTPSGVGTTAPTAPAPGGVGTGASTAPAPGQTPGAPAPDGSSTRGPASPATTTSSDPAGAAGAASGVTGSTTTATSDASGVPATIADPTGATTPTSEPSGPTTSSAAEAGSPTTTSADPTGSGSPTASPSTTPPGTTGPTTTSEPTAGATPAPGTVPVTGAQVLGAHPTADHLAPRADVTPLGPDHGSPAHLTTVLDGVLSGPTGRAPQVTPDGAIDCVPLLVALHSRLFPPTTTLDTDVLTDSPTQVLQTLTGGRFTPAGNVHGLVDQVAADAAASGQPRWIAIDAVLPGGGRHAFVVQADGKGAVRLIDPQRARDGRRSEPSPDGLPPGVVPASDPAFADLLGKAHDASAIVLGPDGHALAPRPGTTSTPSVTALTLAPIDLHAAGKSKAPSGTGPGKGPGKDGKGPGKGPDKGRVTKSRPDAKGKGAAKQRGPSLSTGERQLRDRLRRTALAGHADDLVRVVADLSRLTFSRQGRDARRPLAEDGPLGALVRDSRDALAALPPSPPADDPRVQEYLTDHVVPMIERMAEVLGRPQPPAPGSPGPSTPAPTAPDAVSVPETVRHVSDVLGLLLGNDASAVHVKLAPLLIDAHGNAGSTGAWTPATVPRPPTSWADRRDLQLTRHLSVVVNDFLNEVKKAEKPPGKGTKKGTDGDVPTSPSTTPTDDAGPSTGPSADPPSPLPAWTEVQVLHVNGHVVIATNNPDSVYLDRAGSLLGGDVTLAGMLGHVAAQRRRDLEAALRSLGASPTAASSAAPGTGSSSAPGTGSSAAPGTGSSAPGSSSATPPASGLLEGGSRQDRTRMLIKLAQVLNATRDLASTSPQVRDLASTPIRPLDASDVGTALDPDSTPGIFFLTNATTDAHAEQHLMGMLLQRHRTVSRGAFTSTPVIGGQRRPCMYCAATYHAVETEFGMPMVHGGHPGGIWPNAGQSELALLAAHGVRLRDRDLLDWMATQECHVTHRHDGKPEQGYDTDSDSDVDEAAIRAALALIQLSPAQVSQTQGSQTQGSQITQPTQNTQNTQTPQNTQTTQPSPGTLTRAGSDASMQDAWPGSSSRGGLPPGLFVGNSDASSDGTSSDDGSRSDDAMDDPMNDPDGRYEAEEGGWALLDAESQRQRQAWLQAHSAGHGWQLWGPSALPPAVPGTSLTDLTSMEQLGGPQPASPAEQAAQAHAAEVARREREQAQAMARWYSEQQARARAEETQRLREQWLPQLWGQRWSERHAGEPVPTAQVQVPMPLGHGLSLGPTPTQTIVVPRPPQGQIVAVEGAGDCFYLAFAVASPDAVRARLPHLSAQLDAVLADPMSWTPAHAQLVQGMREHVADHHLAYHAHYAPAVAMAAQQAGVFVLNVDTELRTAGSYFGVGGDLTPMLAGDAFGVRLDVWAVGAAQPSRHGHGAGPSVALILHGQHYWAVRDA